MNVRSLQNLKFVVLLVPEIIGGTQKFGQYLDTPTLLFLQNFSWASVQIDPEKFGQICSAYLYSFLPEIIAIAVLG